MSYELDVFLADDAVLQRDDLVKLLTADGWAVRMRPSQSGSDTPWQPRGTCDNDLLAGIRHEDEVAGPFGAEAMDVHIQTSRKWWMPWAKTVVKFIPTRTMVTMDMAGFFERNDARQTELASSCNRLASCTIHSRRADAKSREAADAVPPEHAKVIMDSRRVISFESADDHNALSFEFQARAAQLLAKARGGLCFNPQDGESKLYRA